MDTHQKQQMMISQNLYKNLHSNQIQYEMSPQSYRDQMFSVPSEQSMLSMFHHPNFFGNNMSELQFQQQPLHGQDS